MSDLPSLLQNVPMPQYIDWLIWMNEKAYRMCDKVTREKGRLTKMVRVHDMANASVMQDRHFFSAMVCLFSPNFPLKKKKQNKTGQGKQDIKLSVSTTA